MSTAIALGYGLAAYALGVWAGYTEARRRWEARRDRARALLRHASRR